MSKAPEQIWGFRFSDPCHSTTAEPGTTTAAQRRSL